MSLQRHDSGQDPVPGRGPDHVAIAEKTIGSLGRSQGRVLAVLIDQQRGGAEDVGVSGQPCLAVGAQGGTVLFAKPAEPAASCRRSCPSRFPFCRAVQGHHLWFGYDTMWVELHYTELMRIILGARSSAAESVQNRPGIRSVGETNAVSE